MKFDPVNASTRRSPDGRYTVTWRRGATMLYIAHAWYQPPIGEDGAILPPQLLGEKAAYKFFDAINRTEQLCLRHDAQQLQTQQPQPQG